MEKKGKNVKNLINVLLFRHFTLEIFNRGVFLPITMTPKYSTTIPNSVNHTQDFMCIKYKAFLLCKQHPTLQGRHCTADSLYLNVFELFTLYFSLFLATISCFTLLSPERENFRERGIVQTVLCKF